jgi:hypothetical protein
LSVLQTRFPELYQPIRNAPNFFVPNLLTKTSVSRWVELQEKKDIPTRLKTRFPGVRIEEAGQSLLSFLFPQLFGQLHQMDDDDADGNTIRNRRAFGIALRLGLPPGTVSRSEIEKLFLGTEENALSLLQAAMQADKLSDFLDLASEVYPLMDAPLDKFWSAASKFFRPSSKTWEPYYVQVRWQLESTAQLANARLLKRLGESQKFAVIAKSLGEMQDPHILPFWLQWHILSFGLYGHAPKENRAHRVFLTQNGLSAALESQADWVSCAFCDDDLLFRLYHPLVLHQLFAKGRWDKRCSEKMQLLIAEPEGLDRVALLFFGSGFYTEPDAFRRFFDFGLYSQRVNDRMLEIEGDEGYAPIRAALRKSLGQLF